MCYVIFYTLIVYIYILIDGYNINKHNRYLSIWEIFILIIFISFRKINNKSLEEYISNIVLSSQMGAGATGPGGRRALELILSSGLKSLARPAKPVRRAASRDSVLSQPQPLLEGTHTAVLFAFSFNFPLYFPTAGQGSAPTPSKHIWRHKYLWQRLGHCLWGRDYLERQLGLLSYRNFDTQ